MEPTPLPGSDNIALIANDADIEAELRLRGLWPKFLACREEAWHKREHTGRWG